MSEKLEKKEQNRKIIKFSEVTGIEDPWWLYCEWAKPEDMCLADDIESALEHPDLQDLYRHYAWNPSEHKRGLLASKLTLMTLDLKQSGTHYKTPAHIALDHIYRWMYWSTLPDPESLLGSKIHPLCLLTFCTLYNIPFWQPKSKRKRLQNYKIGIPADELLDLRLGAKKLYRMRMMVASLAKVDLHDLG